MQLIAVSLLLSIKMLADDHYRQRSYANAAGLDVKDLHVLEISFFKLLNHELYIPPKEYRAALDLLMHQLPAKARRLEKKYAPIPARPDISATSIELALKHLAHNVRTRGMPIREASLSSKPDTVSDRVNAMISKRGRRLSGF